MRYPVTDTNAVEVLGLALDSVASGGALWGGSGWLTGWNITAAAAATAVVVDLHDGGDADGELVARLRIPADTSQSLSRGLPGIPITSGLFLVTSAPITGSLTVARPA